MTIAPTDQPAQVLLPDPAELLIKEAREKARRRRVRQMTLFAILVATCLVALGIVHYTSSPGKLDSSGSDTSATALTCPSSRVRLLGVTTLPGAAVSAGMLVRTSVSSSATCTMSGYPIVDAQLTNHSTAMGRDVRNAYLGGGMTTTAPLPRLSITSHPRVVSFTIDFVTGNGTVCPRIDSFKISLPGSREVLTTRPIFNAGGLAQRMKFIYCSGLQVTPMVKGSSGKN